MPMTPTDARKEEIDFSEVMYQLENRLVIRTGDNLVPSVASLKGKRVGVQVESFGLNAELIKSLLTGHLDATLQDSIEISKALLDTPDGEGYEFSGDAITDPLLGNGIAMGVRKTDPELREMLNHALTAIQKNGVYQAIVDQYLSPKKKPVASFSKSELQYIGSVDGRPFSQAVKSDAYYFRGVKFD